MFAWICVSDKLALRAGGLCAWCAFICFQVPNAHKDIALLALNKLAMAHPGCSDEVQELVGNDMWESVQVAVLPGTAATSGGAGAAVENRL